MEITDGSVTASCSFCLKSKDDVAKLVAGPARSRGPSYVAARNVRRSSTDRVAGHDSNGDATGLARRSARPSSSSRLRTSRSIVCWRRLVLLSHEVPLQRARMTAGTSRTHRCVSVSPAGAGGVLQAGRQPLLFAGSPRPDSMWRNGGANPCSGDCRCHGERSRTPECRAPWSGLGSVQEPPPINPRPSRGRHRDDDAPGSSTDEKDSLHGRGDPHPGGGRRRGSGSRRCMAPFAHRLDPLDTSSHASGGGGPGLVLGGRASDSGCVGGNFRRRSRRGPAGTRRALGRPALCRSRLVRTGVRVRSPGSCQTTPADRTRPLDLRIQPWRSALL